MILADVSLTPPTDSVVGFLGWGVALLLGGLVILWRTREAERKSMDLETKTALREQITKYETRIEFLESDKAELQAKLSSEIKRTARSLELARDALSVRPGAPIQPKDDADFEESTGVHDALNQQRRAEVDKLAREFVESTPPRQRMPSRRD